MAKKSLLKNIMILELLFQPMKDLLFRSFVMRIRKTLPKLKVDIVELAKKARENKLALSDLQGGTFTITNGGVFGSLLSTPILNGPQVGILGMHKIQLRPVAVDEEQIENRPMMYIALSYDHRIIDGKEAVSFLANVKEMLEDPEKLLLEG